MTRIRAFILAAFAAIALASVSLPTPSLANSVVLCSPATAGSGGARQVTNPGTSGGTYSLNSRGCAAISEANSDAAYFRAQGFVPGPNLFSTVQVSGVLSSTTSVQLPFSLPASAVIQGIVIENTTTNAVTGGIDIGKTTGAADIVSAKVCAASCLTTVLDSAILLRVFSTSAQQAIFVTGHTDGNSANLRLTIFYSYF